MKVNISNLTVGNSLPISFSTEFLSPSDYNLTVNTIIINVCGNIVKRGESFILQAECKTVLHFECGTCLAPVSYELLFCVDETFSESDDCDDWKFTGKIIDLKEAIHTNLIMNMPMRVTCADDCKGLCFKCGNNLNEGDCDCDRRKIDARFEGLYSLFNNEEEIK